MKSDAGRERFRAVVARAMAKPLSELPYREPVTSRFRRIPSSQGMVEGTEWRSSEGRRRDRLAAVRTRLTRQHEDGTSQPAREHTYERRRDTDPDAARALSGRDRPRPRATTL